MGIALTASVVGCGARATVRVGATHISCAEARGAVIETLKALSYAVVGVYEPMPGRTTIIAAEKTTPRATYHSSITLTCDPEGVKVTAVQPALAAHEPHFVDDFALEWVARSGTGAVEPALVRTTLAPQDAAGGGSQPTAETVASGLTVQVKRLSTSEARQRFGTDLTAAGVLPLRLAIANHTGRAYLVSVPLLGLKRASGEVVAPLPWTEVSARLAQSPSASGRTTYEAVGEEIMRDQLLEASSNLNGLLLYPAADYSGASIILVDQQSAASERFDGPIGPPP